MVIFGKKVRILISQWKKSSGTCYKNPNFRCLFVLLLKIINAVGPLTGRYLGKMISFKVAISLAISFD